MPGQALGKDEYREHARLQRLHQRREHGAQKATSPVCPPPENLPSQSRAQERSRKASPPPDYVRLLQSKIELELEATSRNKDPVEIDGLVFACPPTDHSSPADIGTMSSGSANSGKYALSPGVSGNQWVIARELQLLQWALANAEGSKHKSAEVRLKARLLSDLVDDEMRYLEKVKWEAWGRQRQDAISVSPTRRGLTAMGRTVYDTSECIHFFFDTRLLN